MILPRRKLLIVYPAAIALSCLGVAAASRTSPAVPVDSRHLIARLFAPSDACIACHNNLSTGSGEDVSIAAAWRATMMANSARDPYWRASVRREMLDFPSRKEEIEAECATCHAPMAAIPSRLARTGVEVLDRLARPLSGRTTPDSLAADGVSCTVCHQIGPERLGDPSTFNGRFAIDTVSPWGSRRIFGAHAIDSGRARIMHSASEFVPTRSDHVRESGLCASCHTLYTDILDSAGRSVGRFPEQVPFLEWRHSAYGTGAAPKTCQSCHMPSVADSTAFSGVLGLKRAGLARHDFLGGNFFVLTMLNRYRADLAVEAPPAELDRAIRKTRETLRSETAALSIEEATVLGSRLVAGVIVRNLTGHKLPTAYPSRRAWIHFVVRDASGAVLFESGRPERDGSIDGNDNDLDARRYEPHYPEISNAGQVQIYEPILGDGVGGVTTGLLSAHRYLKDNRLLPIGFDKQTAERDFSVVGDAAGDQDFRGGEDRVRYAVSLGDARRPLRIEATLLFQPVGFRWAKNLPLRASGIPEIDQFSRYYDELASGSAVALATDAETVP